MTETSILSIVVPVYNETEVIDAFYERMTAVARSLPFAAYEILFIDDGSADDTWARVRGYAERDPAIRPLKLSRNFGHQAAITAGLDHARGDCVVIIDSDLQDPPEVVPEMVARWREGYDVVYGRRSSREGEGRMKLLTASAFYRLLNRLTRINIPVDVGDFRLLSRRAADQLRGLREQDRFVRGLVSWIGFRQTGVTYARDRRYAGDTKYPFRRMMNFALDGITSFSTVPLKLAMWLGYAASALAFIYLVSVFVQKFILQNTIQGWATIMVALLFLGGVQLICIGIMGEYIGRIFNEIKGRPLYVVEEFLDDSAHDTAGVDGPSAHPDPAPPPAWAGRA
ncbi:MAG: glycosyltransferase family 2 protein [Gemmatimonadota bacterium]|jgi:dolichol-phosphate mannosyltransferase